MTDSDLVEAINKFISSYHKKIDKKEFLEAIKTVYSTKKQSKKNTDSDKPKRAPTEYNLFMCSEMEKLKNDNSKLTGKEKMELIAKKWKEIKENKTNSTKEEEKKEEEIQEVKEEVKKEEKTSKKAKK